MASLALRRSAAGGLAVGFALLMAASSAQAQAQFPAFGSLVWGGISQSECASPEGSFNFLNNSSCYFATSSGSLSRPSTGSSSMALANLGSGYVSASVTGVLGGPQNLTGSANAHALIWDTLTFSGAAPGATGTLTVSGDSLLVGNARMSATAILLPLSAIGTIDSPDGLLEGNFATPVSSQPGYAFQQTFSLANGVPMYLAIGVHAEAGVDFSGAGQASINDPFQFDLPQGVSYTSAFQQSLSAVPEPASWLTMLVGFGALGGAMRSRRKQVAIGS